ncbi:hypothetical protein SNE25_15025 [Mucilaginibacter sabulilitoris]|uniref:Toxin-antitoxin system YwqK family antitoxin n=1 Tax=Mucilaginibacter sabulilitoris TaxID=1173583 RepID=A0ABZ0TV83_9SPHI|nr:hypothetical protein [Mucilaginibacter sabulilitoris]WPU96834.1 hypothetical protein SNE25_15025 [Mucilaginibacter sabulilitoris]
MKADSAWAMSQYDMQDTLMTTGTFKDEQLMIPHGKFTFYHFIRPAELPFYSRNTTKKKIVFERGGNFIQETGIYLNGKKNGTWKSYRHGNLEFVNTYKNNILNGRYLNYRSGKILIEGNFVNNKREGNWNYLSYYGDTIKTDIYRKGEFIRSISHLYDKKFRYLTNVKGSKYDIIRYLNSKLSKNKFDSIGKYYASYSFNLTSDGKLISPVVNESADSQIDNAIVSEITLAPNWKPVIQYPTTELFLLTQAPNTDLNAANKGEKKGYIYFDLLINVNEYGKIDISYSERGSIYN